MAINERPNCETEAREMIATRDQIEAGGARGDGGLASGMTGGRASSAAVKRATPDLGKSPNTRSMTAESGSWTCGSGGTSSERWKLWLWLEL